MDLLDDGLIDLGAKRRTDPDAVVRDERGPWTDMPDSNADLEAWTGGGTTDDGCHLCDRDARLRCNSCGRGACGSHSWHMLGVCRDCATEDRMQRWHRSARPSESNWLEDA